MPTKIYKMYLEILSTIPNSQKKYIFKRIITFENLKFTFNKIYLLFIYGPYTWNKFEQLFYFMRISLI
jgi:hypothetical protein